MDVTSAAQIQPAAKRAEAFLPSLSRSSGAVVNVLSVGALAAVPVFPAYSASKAAAFSLTQSLRSLVAGEGVEVHAVLPGPIDTDMVRGSGRRVLELARRESAAVATAYLLTGDGPRSLADRRTSPGASGIHGPQFDPGDGWMTQDVVVGGRFA